MTLFSRCFMRALNVTGVLTIAALVISACQTPPSSNYRTPKESVAAMQQALREDDAYAYLTTLSTPTRKQHESLILIGWSQVREALQALQGELQIVEVEERVALSTSSENAKGPDWVWPDVKGQGARVRVAVQIDGELLMEDFLFIREVDPPPANAASEPWVRLGLIETPTAMHPDPEELQVEASPEEERVNWRLVYPYYPYQFQSQLAPKLMATLQGGSPSGETAQ